MATRKRIGNFKPNEAHLNAFLDSMKPKLLKVLSDLHENPELSGVEYWTTAYIEDSLKEADIEFIRTDPPGLIVKVGEETGPIILIRADMDALPILEPPDGPNSPKSLFAGIMHACGHDAHMTIVMATLLYLAAAAKEKKLGGQVIFVFQGAEETCDGGKLMVENLKRLGLDKVDYVLAFHVFPGLEAGEIGIVGGPVNAGAQTITIRLSAKGGHPGRTFETTDLGKVALLLGLQMLTALTLDPREPSLMTITQINVGVASNVVPPNAEITASLRYTAKATPSKVLELIHNYLEFVEKQYGIETEVVLDRATPPVINAEELVTPLKEATLEAGGKYVKALLSMGSDDASEYSEIATFLFYTFFGTRLGEEPAADLHNAMFVTPTWDVIKLAIKYHVYAICRLLNA